MPGYPDNNAAMLYLPPFLQRLLPRLLPVVLALNLGLLLFFLVFDYQVVFHSDSAVKNLLAQEIVETGQLFPSQWNYANHDLWVFFTHSLVLLCLPFLPNGFGAHIVAGVLSAALIIGGGWLFLRLLDVSRTARLAGLAVLTGGISILMAEHVYGQAAYGSMFYMACALLYCYWQALHARGRAWWLWTLAVALLAIELFWSNPLRATIVYALPLLAAAAALKLREQALLRAHAPTPRLRHWRGAALLLLACALGTLLNVAVMRQVNNFAAPAISWLDYDGMLRNLKVTVHGLLLLFDGTPRWESQVASVAGAYRVLRLLAALALFYLLPLAVLRLLSPRHPGRLFAATFAAAAFALSLLLLLTTSLADMGSPDGAIRYMVPSLLCALLLLAAVAADGLQLSQRQRWLGVAVVALLATSALNTYSFPYRLWYGVPPAAKLPTQAVRLTQFLQQQGLRYGYSSFWHAGKLTVLSAQAVRIRQVNFEHGLPVPMRKLSSDRWYAPDYHQGETFLLVQDSEREQLDLARLAAVAGAPLRSLRFEDFEIHVFRDNLAKLAAWDPAIRQPVRYAVDQHTPHAIGQLRDGALVAEPGSEGTLYYGPFRKVPPGSYHVTFEVETAGPGAQQYGVLDVTSAAGTVTHARQALHGEGPQRVTLQFRTERALDAVEFRVISNGKGRVTMRAAEIVRAPQA